MKIRRILLSLAALAVVGGQARAAQPAGPDAIYFHGKVVTLDPASHVEEAFAVRGDRIVAVGASAKIRALAAKGTRLVDLGGATVIPGLTDSHDHLWNAARYLYRGVDMVGVNALAEMQARLRTAVAQARPGEVVFTTIGWSLQPALTRRDLDAVSADVPIIAIASRRGVGVLNSAALRKAGISRETPVYMGVKVPVDASGEPTGASPGYPAAMLLMDAMLPKLTVAQQDEMVRREVAERHSLGITSVRELALWPEAVAGLQRLRREGKLGVRMSLGLEFPDQANSAKHMAELGTAKHDDPWLFIDSVSEEPWTPGAASLEDFTRLAQDLNRQGWRAAPHVNADMIRGGTADDATEKTLTAYEAADRDSALNGKRWYMEHAPSSTAPMMDRMAKLGVVISIQDMGFRPAAVAPLSPARMEHYNPVRGFLDHRLTVIGGSDYSGPTPAEREPNNPMFPFYFFVTRKTVNGAVLGVEEKISREEALRMFTVNPAYAAFQEKLKGQIAPGMLADFVILNQDLMAVPDEKILATHPLATFVGGRRVYSAPGSKF